MSDTPRTDADVAAGHYPSPESAERIMFDGTQRVAISPEDYECLFDSARTLERELAAANAKVKRLEEAGDRMLEVLHGDEGQPFSGWIADALEVELNWHKAKEAK